MEKKITIEIIVPDNGKEIIYNARDKFHDAFTGNQDYVDSNVVVWDNSLKVRKETNDTGFTETGLLVDFKNCTDRVDAANRLMCAFETLTEIPEYIKMVSDKNE